MLMTEHGTGLAEMNSLLPHFGGTQLLSHRQKGVKEGQQVWEILPELAHHGGVA